MSDAGRAMVEAVPPADFSEPLERLRAGEVLVELRHDSAAARAAGLDALLAHFAGPETKIVWIGNPLRSPLTIERIFLQAAGPDTDLRIEGRPEELAAILQAAAEGSARCLLILHQPETLDPAARDTLAAMSRLLAGATPAIQFLFCGGSVFRPIAPSPATVHAPERSLILRTPLDARGAIRWSPRVLLPVLAALAILLTAWVNNRPDPLSRPVDAARAAAPRSPDRPSDTDGAAIAPATVDVPTVPAAPPPTDTAALRRKFDAFLAQQSPQLAKLPPHRRDALFEEFVQRQNRRDKPIP